MLKTVSKSTPFKFLVVTGVLGAAAAGPMAITSGPKWLSSLASRWTASQPAGAEQPAAAQFGPGTETPPTIPTDDLPTGAFHDQVRAMSLADVFRLDMTLRELMARWPRVSTSLPDLQLQGYRVPLLTGTSETDLAGSLTYYFNAAQQVERITFNGTTGDGTRLVQLLASRFGFVRRPTREPNILVYEIPVRRGRPSSHLTLKLAPLLKASVPNQRYDVALVINRPPPEPLVSRLLGPRG